MVVESDKEQEIYEVWPGADQDPIDLLTMIWDGFIRGRSKQLKIEFVRVKGERFGD